MKKFLALLISAMLVLGLVAFPAAADGEVTFTVDTVDDVNPGDTVQIALTIDGEYQAHSVVGHIYYNADYLQVTGVANGPVAANRPDDSMFVKDYTTNAGDVSFGLICPTEPFSGSGVLLTVTFQVLDTCTEDQPLDLQINEFFYQPAGAQQENIDFIAVDGAINLVEDVNPTDPPVDPTEPPVDPTEPPVDPTEPPVEPGVAYFTMGSEYDVPGGSQIELPLDVAGDYEAHIINLVINYDPDVLEVVGVELGDVLPEDAFPSIDYSTPGVIHVGIVCPTDPVAGDGTLVTVTFNVADDFDAPTPVEVEISELEYMPGTVAEPVDYEIENGEVTPAEPPVVEPVVFTMESKYNVAGGSQIDLDFTLEGDYEAHILYATLNYDPEVLTVVNVEVGGLIPEDAAVVLEYGAKGTPGEISIGIICPTDGITGDGVIVTVTFDVTEDFTEPTVIEVNINEFENMPVGATTGTPIEYTANNGIVTPLGSEPGPTDEPGPGPQPPVTGAASLIGLGIIAIATGAGVVVFRKKED